MDSATTNKRPFSLVRAAIALLVVAALTSMSYVAVSNGADKLLVLLGIDCDVGGNHG